MAKPALFRQSLLGMTIYGWSYDLIFLSPALGQIPGTPKS
jgi:hypothetical protein